MRKLLGFFFFFLTRKRERKKLVFFWCFSIGFAQVPITKKQFNTRSMDAKKTSGSRIMSWRRRWGEEIGDNIPILRFAELFSDSGTSPGSRERETDYEVRGVQPQPKIAHNRGSAQPVVAPEAGTTKTVRGGAAR